MADPKFEDMIPIEEDHPRFEDMIPLDHDNSPAMTATERPLESEAAAGSTGFLNMGGIGPMVGAGGKTAMDAITGVNGPLAGGSIQDLIDEYNHHHKKLQSDFAKSAKEHPIISGAANMAGIGALLGPLGASPSGLAAGGAALAAPEAAEDISKGEYGQAVTDLATGAATNFVAGNLAHEALPLIGQGFKKVGGMFSNAAENAAVKATGATGAQAAKFSEGTGRELLDRGVVKFGSCPGDIACNANSQIEAAGADIGDTLGEKLKDTTVDRHTVIKYVKDKIAAMKGDDSKTELVAQLKNKIGNIEEQITPRRTRATAASSIPLRQAEEIKRGYQSNSNYLNPEVDKANKIVAQAYRQAVEDSATAASPELGAGFLANKKTISLLSPVAEASERRANTLNQSPHGGLLDTTRAVAGHAMGGNPGAVAAVGAKALYPRIASMKAVSADKIGNILKDAPEAVGKFSPSLRQAAERGPVSLGATDYILQQTNPEYRAHRNRLLAGGDENAE